MATIADHTASRQSIAPKVAAAERLDWPLVFVAFLVTAAVVIAKALLSAKTTPLIYDTDDAMRLVTVRDLLGGQNWFDHIQHRLNAPFGAEIHWSHLVDAGIAAVILLLRPFAGGMTETIAVYIWPLLLLLALLSLTGRLAFRLGGREAMLPALVLPVVSVAVIPEFSPGRIDHHSIQILLTLLMAWGAIETIERPRFALLTGLAAALSLAIGIEGLPSVLAAILAVSLTWVVRPERGPALCQFGLSFALATIAAQINQYPPSRWFEPACDEISFVYAAFAAGVGLVLVLLSVLPLAHRAPWQRLAAGGAFAVVLALALAKAFPQCLGGPYAGLDPWLIHNWLDQIDEAKPIWASLASALPFGVAAAFPPLLGLLVIAGRLVWGERKDLGEWLVLGLFLLLSVVVMIAQVRGTRLAMPLALPAAGCVIAAARRRYLSGRRVTDALIMLAGWVGFAGLAIGMVVALATAPFEAKASAAPQTQAGQMVCRMPQAFAGLAKLPPTRVMAPVDLGSHLLLFTPHAVVGAPYQRDEAGVRDTFRFLNGSIAAARQILGVRGVTLVVICPDAPEMGGLPDAAPDSFVKLFAQNRLPNWLLPISKPTDVLKVFRVEP
ncbi:MAG TPA: hypothetical protein VL418_03440 [Devosiaceae bacterium]|nr:hypothetical protein [Devosiaceae bacterium]